MITNETNDLNQQSTITPQKNSGVKPFCIVGILSGILSIIFGIITLKKDAGSYVSSQSYGGDAYTGIQNASAKSANNIQDLAEILKFGLGGLLIVLGIAICCYFFIKIKQNNKS